MALQPGVRMFCVATLVAGNVLLALAVWGEEKASGGKAPRTSGGDPKSKSLIAVAPPPFSEGIFPCSDCHDPEDKVNRERRPVVEGHENIIFEHDAKNRWCLDCHDAQQRDKLHLADGRLIDFKDSYLLCGQCHGPELRDWWAGAHGKRTGSWSGQKEYLLCAHCHNPHSPSIKPIPPMPPPIRQEELR